MSRLSLACILCGAFAFLSGQVQPAAPHFGAVSIRIQRSDYEEAVRSHGPVYPGGRYANHSAVLWSLITFAHPQFMFPGKTIVGLPDWAGGKDGAVFDIEAVPAVGTSPDLTTMRRMMDGVLVERFGLRYHIEQHTMPVFLLKTSDAGSHYMKPSPPGQQSLKVSFGSQGVYGRGISMDDLAGTAAAFFFDRPILNRTGLSGFYDIEMPPPPGVYMGRFDNKSLTMHELEMLGFELVSQQADVPVMVIDHVAKPTPN